VATNRPENILNIPIITPPVITNKLSMSNSKLIDSHNLWFLSGMNCDYKLLSVDLSYTTV
jgi:hypothetical protein